MVFPLQDEQRPLRIFPSIMVGLIALNVLMFIIELLQGSHLEAFLNQYAVVPARYTLRQAYPSDIPFPFWWTTVSAMFLHGGWLHLLGNMIYLRIFGDNIEETMGHFRFLIFYLLCGIAATGTHILFNPSSTIPSLGASGAIAGVLGAYLLFFPKNRIDVLLAYSIIPLPAVVVIGFWFVLQLFSGLASIHPGHSGAVPGGIAYTAHVGGFIAGVLLAPLLKQRNIYAGSRGPISR